MPTEVRGDPTTIDAAWMTEALEAGGVAAGATVLDVQLEGLIGTGQMGRNARFGLRWDDPGDRPATVVGKFPAEDLRARTTGFDNGSYHKELVFYRDLKPSVGIRTPRPYATRWDDAAPDFVLLMEDLASSIQGDQLVGLTADQAALAVEQAVALHHPRWGDDRLAVVVGRSAEEAAEMIGAIYAATMEGTLSRLGDGLNNEAITLVGDLAPLVERWALGRGTPSTLVHMDFRPDNFLFAAEPEAPPLVVVDWQTFGYGRGTNDLAYMIGGSFEPTERAAVETALVAEYGQRLRATGIHYPPEDCWRDYCETSVWGVIMSVIATMLAGETERGNAMLTTMLRRHAQHAIDLDALDLLREDDR
jgi:hypothetical protein